MTGYGDYPAEMMPIIEAMVAIVVMVAFLFSSLFTLRNRHADKAMWHVHLGALIQGAIFGVVVGYLVLPMRMMLMEGELPPRMTGIYAVAMLALIIALRRGLIARLPGLGPQVKAYRRASLRRSIENSQKQLDKLAPKEDRA